MIHFWGMVESRATSLIMGEFISIEKEEEILKLKHLFDKQVWGNGG